MGYALVILLLAGVFIYAYSPNRVDLIDWLHEDFGRYLYVGFGVLCLVRLATW